MELLLVWTCKRSKKFPFEIINKKLLLKSSPFVNKYEKKRLFHPVIMYEVSLVLHIAIRTLDRLSVLLFFNEFSTNIVDAKLKKNLIHLIFNLLKVLRYYINRVTYQRTDLNLKHNYKSGCATGKRTYHQGATPVGIYHRMKHTRNF